MSDQTDAGFELPNDLREEVLKCAVEKQISLDWLVNLYRRGYNAKLGESGEYPFGKLRKDDQGELTVAMAADPQNGVIRLEFGKPVGWLALPATHARHMAKLLWAAADALEKKLS